MICDLCHQSPHHPRCPNAPEPQVIAVCEKCGEEFYEDDYFIAIDYMLLCEDCALDYIKHEYGRRAEADD